MPFHVSQMYFIFGLLVLYWQYLTVAVNFSEEGKYHFNIIYTILKIKLNLFPKNHLFVGCFFSYLDVKLEVALVHLSRHHTLNDFHRH